MPQMVKKVEFATGGLSRCIEYVRLDLVTYERLFIRTKRHNFCDKENLRGF